MKKFLFLTVTAVSMTLSAGKPPKTPPPTVESVKAMSYFDLLTALTENEELMLANANSSVPDTINVLIRIHEKRLPRLRGHLANSEECLRQCEEYHSVGSPRVGFDLVTRYEKTSDYDYQKHKDGYLKYQRESQDNLRRCENTITVLKDLQERLAKKKSK